MKLGHRRLKAAVDEENPYWMSFSDIMSGLLVIFILASVILILQLMLKQKEFDETRVKFEDEIEALKRAEEVRRTILEEIVADLRGRGVVVEMNANASVLHISNERLGFDSGSDEIKPQYQDTAYLIGDVLQRRIAMDDRASYLDTVFIEGHTDSRPFNRAPCEAKGNWCLSAFRAISLWLYWEEALPDERKLSGMRNRGGSPLFSVSGYAASRPLVEHEVSEEDLSRNRRIDLRFTIRRPESAELEAVRDLVEEIR
ncbi:MAG: chemotaxis protein MotB [Haliea sp.]|mgnify:CR=1 FL=1|nr:chemotaxis protein MotB [Haliea sp.]|tara:strand:+ start:134988 stop:135758 length:771 start_codon:yes stop_codon:yes gene_type:complete